MSSYPPPSYNPGAFPPPPVSGPPSGMQSRQHSYQRPAPYQTPYQSPAPYDNPVHQYPPDEQRPPIQRPRSTPHMQQQPSDYRQASHQPPPTSYAPHPQLLHPQPIYPVGAGASSDYFGEPVGPLQGQRPHLDPRRISASSHRSQGSAHSHLSQHERRRAKHADSDLDDLSDWNSDDEEEYQEIKRRRRRQRWDSHGEGDGHRHHRHHGSKSSNKDGVRPTMGDSMFAVWDSLKGAMSSGKT